MNEQEEQFSPSPGAALSRGAAAAVQDFYERYPYPRPVDSLEKYRRIWQDRERRLADYHLFWPGRPYREDRSILIAGCGTSQAAKHAVRWPDAQVTGIDFSATSVNCTEVLKRKYNLKNLHVRQFPLERARDLGESFDQIVCTGVLHHLGDPDAGLSALRDVLKPDGAMHLMLYAPYGRTGLYLLQDFCRRVGIHATDDGIRDLIAALRFLPPGHPLESLLREAPDFRHEAALADALLHPQDRAYSVPQLFDFLDRGGLSFGRWIRQAPYTPHCGVLAKIPQASRIAQLSRAEQYAAAELFRGTMVAHSLVVYRNDPGSSPLQVSFAGDGWRRYIPIRMPDTICVQERLPAGAAGVLINRNHTYRDLILPIGSTEKRWFDCIDGSRTISDIAENDAAGTFFERLWWHDQVVFDASIR
jgi:SAM-dependent methyltransferase